MVKGDKKGNYITRTTLAARREGRTVDDMQAEIAAKDKEIEELKAAANGGGQGAKGQKKGGGGDGVEVKAAFKEVKELRNEILSITDSRDSLKKEYDKLAAERDRIAAERDQVVEEKAALSSRLKSFDTAVETDSRLVEAKRQLEESEERSTELFVKYEEACEFNNRWKTRFEKLGLGAESTAKDAKLADVRKQLKELEAEKLTLAQEKLALSGQVRAAKLEQVDLQQLKSTNASEIRHSKAEVRSLQCRAEVAEKALEEVGDGEDGSTSSKKALAIRALKAERLAEQLKPKVDELEAQLTSLTDQCKQQKEQSQEYERRATTAEAKMPKIVVRNAKLETDLHICRQQLVDLQTATTKRSTRYRQLVENLHLSEQDVSTLLEKGPQWPPIRDEVRCPSLVDLLHTLHQDRLKAVEEKKMSKDRITSLETEKEKLEKERDERGGEAEKKVVELEKEKVDLAARLDSTVQYSLKLEKNVRAIVDENCRLEKELEQLAAAKDTDEEMKTILSQRLEIASLGDKLARSTREWEAKTSKLSAQLSDLGDSAEKSEQRAKDLEVEKNKLTNRLDEQRRVSWEHEQRADKHQKEASRTTTGYQNLLSNLRLSENDVSDLLEKGGDWPPIRRDVPASSLVELLVRVREDRIQLHAERKGYKAQIAAFKKEQASWAERGVRAEEAEKKVVNLEKEALERARISKIILKENDEFGTRVLQLDQDVTLLETEKNRLTDVVDECKRLIKQYEEQVHDLERVLSRSDTRYTDLLTNLRLSKSDVKDLLREGPNWPSIRREVPSSSLVDLLNILHADRVKVAYEKTTFETRIATFEAEKATLEKRVEAAEQALKTPPVVAPTNGNGMNTPTSMSRSRSSSRSGELADEISRERDRLRLEVDSARREREGEREKVLQLRERVLALETSSANGRSESRASTSAFGTPSLTGTSGQAFIDRLRKKINELNQQVVKSNEQIAALMEENTNLLFQPVGNE